MKEFHLAQINIALALAPMDSEEMRDFMRRIDEINRLAERFEGFVWRLKDENGNATAIQAFDNPDMLINMSVWQSIDCLKDYTYKSAHLDLIRDRARWFGKMKDPHLVLWWIPAGHVPTIEEGKARLALLDQHGPTAEAFTFARTFEPPVA